MKSGGKYKIINKLLYFGLVLTISLCGCKRYESHNSDAETVVRDIFAMDTYMSLTATGENAKEALDKATSEITRLDKLLSVGDESSEVYGINNEGDSYLSEDTVYLVERSIELYNSTEGVFDITVYPLMDMWGFTTKKYKVPNAKDIESALVNVSASKIEYDMNTKNINLPEGVQIDFGGIAKGYTSDKIMGIFKEYGIESGMVSLGGNVQLHGKKPDGSLWKIGIENPDDEEKYIGIIEAENKAIITSGGYERYFEEDGINYHHIINPTSGYPADSGLISVTIVSEDGTLADGLSTALFVMGKEKALEYWKKNSDKFDAVLMEENGRITITEGLEEMFSSDYEYKIESLSH